MPYFYMHPRSEQDYREQTVRKVATPGINVFARRCRICGNTKGVSGGKISTLPDGRKALTCRDCRTAKEKP